MMLSYIPRYFVKILYSEKIVIGHYFMQCLVSSRHFHSRLGRESSVKRRKTLSSSSKAQNRLVYVNEARVTTLLVEATSFFGALIQDFMQICIVCKDFSVSAYKVKCLNFIAKFINILNSLHCALKLFHKCFIIFFY